MMRRFASRGSRVAAYFADVLLIALAPALFFYPAYYKLVPAPPKLNLLPLELMDPAERLAYETQARAYQDGISTVGMGTVAVFFLAFVLYQTIALLTRAPDGSHRGQTFGMRAVSTRVLRTSNEPIAFHHALRRGLLFAISAALLLGALVLSANLLLLLVLDDSSSVFDDGSITQLIAFSVGVILIHILALIPKRSLIDLGSGTCQTALYGDLVAKEHR